MNERSPQDEEAHYLERARRKKELIDRRIARATIDRGVFLVNTGNGKGKSSSGFGMLARLARPWPAVWRGAVHREAALRPARRRFSAASRTSSITT